jgi:hypothetical protein
MSNKLTEHLKRHYAAYILITNILCTVPVAAFAVLGLLQATMSVPVLIGNAIVFGLLYALGKFGNEQLEDIPKIDEFEKGYPYV